MNLMPLHKPTVVSSVFLQVILLQKLSTIKWLSRRRKEDRGRFHAVISNYTAVTEALKPGFGAGKHFVQRSKDDKEADAGNTNYTYIQEFFCSNLTKVDSLEQHVISYGFKDILMLRELHELIRLTLE